MNTSPVAGRSQSKRSAIKRMGVGTLNASHRKPDFKLDFISGMDTCVKTEADQDQSPGNLCSLASSSSPSPAAQEYSIIIPKTTTKQFHVMRYNSSFNVDFSKWSQVKMERENNQRQGNADEDQPKFGAGSEFGREAKEEARKKKFGYVSHKYRSEDQPWILKCGGKNGKKFRGVREGGVGENSAYYVFSHNAEGKIEACPIQEWYNFQPVQRYKALSVEEAEQEFGRRNKVINYFSLMLRKRLRNEEDGDIEDEDEIKKKGKSKKKEKDLKISEMDEWMDSDEDDSDSDEDKSDDEEGTKKKKKLKKKSDAKKKKQATKKKKKGSDESAVEESDDGDEEGRELDYISDSSDSESDHEGKVDKEMKGVAEESALRKLLTSDEDGSEDEEGSDKPKSEPEENPPSEEETNTPGTSIKKKKKKLKKKSTLNSGNTNSAANKKTEGAPVKEEESSSDFSPDSSDSELEAKGKLLMKETSSGNNSRSGSPSQLGADSKRLSSEPLSKKPRLDNYASESGITEEAVRRYLSRKPMTATELLQKFKKPKNNLTSEQLVNCMTQILKRINPIRQTIKNRMYLSLKPS